MNNTSSLSRIISNYCLLSNVCRQLHPGSLCLLVMSCCNISTDSFLIKVFYAVIICRNCQLSVYCDVCWRCQLLWVVCQWLLPFVFPRISRGQVDLSLVYYYSVHGLGQLSVVCFGQYYHWFFVCGRMYQSSVVSYLLPSVCNEETL